MSQRTDEYLRGVPLMPYDLLREGLTALLIVALVVVALAAIFSSPDYPPVRSEDVARLQPVAYLKTSASFLAGTSGIDGYGPPYTNDTANAQSVFGLAPASWFGVRIPLDPAQDFVLKPLGHAAALDPALNDALSSYTDASSDQQAAWVKAYLAALDTAQVQNGEVKLGSGDYGPVAVMMDGMLRLGRGGLLEGALESDAHLPYSLDFTRSLLFFQDDVDANVASSLDMTGDQWGVSHETGGYPGAWWLWPYTFLYQVPFIAVSDNADLLIGLIMLVIFLLLVFTPFIPFWRRVPRWLRAYRLIWRDWYRDHGEGRPEAQPGGSSPGSRDSPGG
jgi:hypothetical protein